ncbi:MAG: hypothetical protein ACFB2W_00400 [Leptolyngbyaceae cyanobacterium]
MDKKSTQAKSFRASLQSYFIGQPQQPPQLSAPPSPISLEPVQRQIPSDPTDLPPVDISQPSQSLQDPQQSSSTAHSIPNASSQNNAPANKTSAPVESSSQPAVSQPPAVEPIAQLKIEPVSDSPTSVQHKHAQSVDSSKADTTSVIEPNSAAIDPPHTVSSHSPAPSFITPEPNKIGHSNSTSLPSTLETGTDLTDLSFVQREKSVNSPKTDRPSTIRSNAEAIDPSPTVSSPDLTSSSVDSVSTRSEKPADSSSPLLKTDLDHPAVIQQKSDFPQSSVSSTQLSIHQELANSAAALPIVEPETQTCGQTDIPAPIQRLNNSSNVSTDKADDIVNPRDNSLSEPSSDSRDDRAVHSSNQRSQLSSQRSQLSSQLSNQPIKQSTAPPSISRETQVPPISDSLQRVPLSEAADVNLSAPEPKDSLTEPNVSSLQIKSQKSVHQKPTTAKPPEKVGTDAAPPFLAGTTADGLGSESAEPIQHSTAVANTPKEIESPIVSQPQEPTPHWPGPDTQQQASMGTSSSHSSETQPLGKTHRLVNELAAALSPTEPPIIQQASSTSSQISENRSSKADVPGFDISGSKTADQAQVAVPLQDKDIQSQTDDAIASETTVQRSDTTSSRQPRETPIKTGHSRAQPLKITKENTDQTQLDNLQSVSLPESPQPIFPAAESTVQPSTVSDTFSSAVSSEQIETISPPEVTPSETGADTPKFFPPTSPATVQPTAALSHQLTEHPQPEIIQAIETEDITPSPIDSSTEPIAPSPLSLQSANEPSPTAESTAPVTLLSSVTKPIQQKPQSSESTTPITPSSSIASTTESSQHMAQSINQATAPNVSSSALAPDVLSTEATASLADNVSEVVNKFTSQPVQQTPVSLPNKRTQNKDTLSNQVTNQTDAPTSPSAGPLQRQLIENIASDTLPPISNDRQNRSDTHLNTPQPDRIGNGSGPHTQKVSAASQPISLGTQKKTLQKNDVALAGTSEATSFQSNDSSINTFQLAPWPIVLKPLGVLRSLQSVVKPSARPPVAISDQPVQNTSAIAQHTRDGNTQLSDAPTLDGLTQLPKRQIAPSGQQAAQIQLLNNALDDSDGVLRSPPKPQDRPALSSPILDSQNSISPVVSEQIASPHSSGNHTPKLQLKVLQPISVLRPLPPLRPSLSTRSSLSAGVSDISHIPASTSLNTAQTPPIQRQAAPQHSIEDLPDAWSSLEDLVTHMKSASLPASPSFPSSHQDSNLLPDRLPSAQPPEHNSIQRQIAAGQSNAFSRSSLEDLVTQFQHTPNADTIETLPSAAPPPLSANPIKAAEHSTNIPTVSVQRKIDLPSTSQMLLANGFQRAQDLPTVTIQRASNTDQETRDIQHYSHYLELLAQEVYGLLRQRLCLEQERRGPRYPR